jgi:hypothetical protein
MKRVPLIAIALLLIPCFSLVCLGAVGVVKVKNIIGLPQPIPPSSLFTTQYARGTYRLSWYTVVTSTTATSGSISGQLQYSDQDLGAESIPFMSNVSASTVGPSSGSVVFRATSGTVKVSVNFDSSVNGTPTYNLHLVVENIALQ